MSEIRIPHVEPLFPFEIYGHVIEPLSDADGGGYLLTFPDPARLHGGWGNHRGSHSER